MVLLGHINSITRAIWNVIYSWNSDLKYFIARLIWISLSDQILTSFSVILQPHFDFCRSTTSFSYSYIYFTRLVSHPGRQRQQFSAWYDRNTRLPPRHINYLNREIVTQVLTNVWWASAGFTSSLLRTSWDALDRTGNSYWRSNAKELLIYDTPLYITDRYSLPQLLLMGKIVERRKVGKKSVVWKHQDIARNHELIQLVPQTFRIPIPTIATRLTMFRAKIMKI